jgi:TorA maturation chaperone TorD
MMSQLPVLSEGLEESAELSLSRGLACLASSAQEELSAFATRTRTEYARLFLGPREVLAPLHESAYLSGTSRMFTAQTLAVRDFYERFGYVMRLKNREPEDGIGPEFEFLRRLCGRCLTLLAARESKSTEGLADAIEQIGRLLEAQRLFKEQHLLRWAGDFAERVIEHDRSGFYAVWATYLITVLDEDESLLNSCFQLLDISVPPTERTHGAHVAQA